MKMDRSKITRKNISDNDDGYVNAWDITRDAWAFSGGVNAEERLQRDVGNLIKSKG